ncbi:MAG: alpha/beta hydrolase [Candidatus Paceibacterota bacterium]
MKESDKVPHLKKPLVYTKSALGSPDRVILCINGYQGTAVEILRFVSGLKIPELALAAVEADDLSWFPRGVDEPRREKEPEFSAAIERVDKAVEEIKEIGFSAEKIHFLGFSQGACLALEYVLKKGGPWGGVFALAGCFVGAKEEVSSLSSDLQETPIFLGSGDLDELIPIDRVRLSSEVAEKAGALVTLSVYQGVGHKINKDEAEYIKTFFTEN